MTSRFDAFISYSYGADRRLASAVQRCLHRLARPWYRPRALRVFRDVENLGANDDLWQMIRAQLTASRFFILLASPRAAVSPWVRREVAYWQEHRDRESFLIVLTDGEIRWDDTRDDFDWDRTTALPPQLTGWFRSEPLWVNLAWARQETQLSLRHSKFRAAVATLAAPLHGRTKDELDDEDVRQHRLATRLRWAAVAGLCLLTVVATVLGLVALDRQREVSDQRDRALSRELAAKSETLGDRDPVLAKLLSVAAWRVSQTAEARAAMLRMVTQPGIAVLHSGDQPVNSVAFGPDGRTVAVAGAGVQLLDVDTRRQVGALSGHTAVVRSVIFSPDGRLLATSGEDSTVRLWGVDTQRRIEDLHVIGPDHSVLPAIHFHSLIAFSPDAKVLAVGGDDGAIRLRDTGTGQQIGEPLTGHVPDQLLTVGPSVAFSPDGTKLASAASDGTVRFWEVGTHRQIGAPVAGHPADEVAFNSPAVVFSPDGRLVATAASDGGVRLWDVGTHALTGPSLTGATPDRVVTPPAMAFSPTGKTLAVGGGDGAIMLWDLAGRQQVGVPMTGHTDQVRSLAFSPDGRKLVSGSSDGTVRLWDVTARQQFDTPLAGHTGPVYSAAFSPDGRSLATGGDNGGGAQEHGSSGACEPAGKTCTSSGGGIEVTDGRSIIEYGPPGGGRPERGSVATLLLWDVAGRRQLGAPLSVAADAIGAVALGPDGTRLVTGSLDGSSTLWDVRERRKIRTTPTDHDSGVLSVAFSPDGHLIASGASKVDLWDARTLRRVDVLDSGGDGSTSSVAFSPDGKLLATSHSDKQVLLWDVRTRQRIGRLASHAEAVVFDPSGTVLATAGYDGTVQLWDVGTRQQTGDPLIGHTGTVNSVAFSPDGSLLATAGGDNSVRLWDVAARSQVSGPYLGHELPAWSVRFSPDGRTLASTGADNMVRLWDVGYTLDVVASLCAGARRSLTTEEWARHVPDVPYQHVCATA